jgi:ATP-dependent protease HslVU (ClpYQ) peptidase subunit
VSETIDIPIKTSGAFLRSLSKTKVKGRSDLLTAESSYSMLLSLATPSERAILEGLAQQLELRGDNLAKAARDKASMLQKDKKALEAKKKKTYGDVGSLAKQIRTTLVNRWPELTNLWNPQVQEFLGSESDTIIKAIESHPKYAEFDKRYQEGKHLTHDVLKLDKHWVKTQRVLRTLDNVALAANLPKLTDALTVARYHRLLESEQGTLGHFGPLPNNPDPLPANPDPVAPGK